VAGEKNGLELFNYYTVIIQVYNFFQEAFGNIGQPYEHLVSSAFEEIAQNIYKKHHS